MTSAVTFMRSRSTYGIDVTADGQVTALCDDDHRRYHVSTTTPLVGLSSSVDLFYHQQSYVVSTEHACLFVYRDSFKAIDSLEQPQSSDPSNATGISANIRADDDDLHLRKATRISRVIRSQIEFNLMKRNISTIASLQLLMKGAMQIYKQQLLLGKFNSTTTSHIFPHRRDIKQPYWRSHADATRLQDVIKSVFQ